MNAEVQVSISSPSSNDSRDDGHVCLRVEDRMSGEVLVHVDIPAGRWWRLCQGSTQRHEAFVSSNLHRVGKRMENTSVPLGPSWEMGEQEAEAAADAHEQRGEYETASVHRTNQGWTAVFRRWVDANGAES